MKYFDYIVQNPTGLHARPASSLIVAARAWQSELAITKDQRSANPKSLMSVLALNVNQGDQIRITAEGPDEEAAIAGLKTFMKEHL